MTDLLNLIDGDWRPASDGGTTSRGPSPDGLSDLAPVPDSRAADVQAALAAARGAAPAWTAMSPYARADLLRGLARELRERAQTMAELMCVEIGKPVAEGLGEVENAAKVVEFYAGLAHELGGEHVPSMRPGVHIVTRREPRGVAAVITPWNFPVNLPLVKMAPALLAGNTVVWKPASPGAEASVELARAIVAAGIPAGVVNMVLGDGPTAGAALAAADVDAVSFTGSCDVGHQIERQGAERGVKVLTELGGKNVVVVCDDADLDLAVDAIVNGAFRYAGQKCTATSRVVATPGVHDELVARVCAKLDDLPVGLPSDPSTFLGPTLTEAAVAGALAAVAEAVSAGATVVRGGHRPVIDAAPNGHFLEATVLTGVSSSMRVARAELFAPVLAVLAAADPGEAFEIADSTEFGLSASIFTTDLETAFRFADATDTGAVQVNLPTAGLELQVPVGGRRDSGAGGVEQGRAALDFYTRNKTISIRHGAV